MQALRRDECIWCAISCDNPRQPEPAQAIEREAMPDDHRRQQETRYTKPQRHDV
jgi:hypothetical protein